MKNKTNTFNCWAITSRHGRLLHWPIEKKRNALTHCLDTQKVVKIKITVKQLPNG